MTPQARKAAPSQKARARSAARLGAVQALYQMDLASTDAADVVEEFRAHRFTGAEAGEEGGREQDATDTDMDFFEALVSGVVTAQREVDRRVNGTLAGGWRLDRLDSILRALLRAGAYELSHRADVPARVVIDEYVNVAHAFFDGDQPGFVNGVLDRLAHEARPAEFTDGTR